MNVSTSNGFKPTRFMDPGSDSDDDRPYFEEFEAFFSSITELDSLLAILFKQMMNCAPELRPTLTQVAERLDNPNDLGLSEDERSAVNFIFRLQPEHSEKVQENLERVRSLRPFLEKAFTIAGFNDFTGVNDV